MRSKSYKGKDETKEVNSKPTKRFKGKSKKDKTYSNDAKLNSEGRDNDPNFYFTSPELAQQAGQLSFQNMVGIGGIDNFKVPSIMKINLNPCPGITVSGFNFQGSIAMDHAGSCHDASSGEKRGINLMSSKLYTMLSTFTGRTSQYAPQDVAMMVLAVSSIAELSEHIRRAFGIALTYNPRNRNLPLGLIRSMGINTVDFLANIPAYRMRFNVLMTRINQIPLLDNIAYIRKSREIYQRIYMDSPSPMAQLFYYAPRSVWMLDETTDPQGTMLMPVSISSGNTAVTIGSLLDSLDTMITRLLESSTLNLIYADLLNMANKIKVPVWQFDYLAENYVVMPVYNRNASLQLHHIKFMGDPMVYSKTGQPVTWRKTGTWKWDANDATLVTGSIEFTSNNCVVCDPNKNNVVYNPLFRDHSYTKAVVDMDTPTPTLEDRIEALRFSVASSGSKIVASEWRDGQTGYLEWLPSLPDHYATTATIYTNIDYTVGSLVGSDYSYSAAFSMTSAVTMPLEKFDMSPFLYILDGTTGEVNNLSGDLDFYTIVDHAYLSRVNELMYTGLFEFRV